MFSDQIDVKQVQYTLYYYNTTYINNKLLYVDRRPVGTATHELQEKEAI